MKEDANDKASKMGPNFAKAMPAWRDAAIKDAVAEPSLGARDLLAFNVEQDPSCLIGRRWLCRGGAALWVGKSGIGKSSLLTQAAICWALNEPFFGMRPVKNLKSVIIQAENDIGDLSEEMRGIINALELSWAIDKIHRNIRYYTQAELSGVEFISWLEKVLISETPDLVWIDPLFAFLGGDANKQDVLTGFLRSQLNPLLKRHQVGGMIIHHTPKPPKDPKQLKAVGIDLSYAGSGSAEITNWARAIMALMPGEAVGEFSLVAAKRGGRAGLTHPNGAPAPGEIRLAHSGTQQIYWKQLDPLPEEAEMATELDDIAFAKLLDSTLRSKVDVINLIHKSMRCTQADARMLMENVITRHRLFELKAIDGPRNCGMFTVSFDRSLRFIRNHQPTP